MKGMKGMGHSKGMMKGGMKKGAMKGGMGGGGRTRYAGTSDGALPAAAVKRSPRGPRPAPAVEPMASGYRFTRQG